MKQIRSTFVSAILAGFAIALGGTIFLSVENKVVGAFFFTIGLFVVCTSGLHLFTGKVCYTFENGKDYAAMLPVIWLGNLAGTALAAFLIRLTRAASIAEKAAAMCAVKTSDSLLSLFVLGFFCNIFIYIGVDGYKNIPHEVGKYLALVFGVVGFILCGTEHCVADMFYFSAAGAWSLRAVLCLFVITLGNCAGGVFFPLLKKLKQ